MKITILGAGISGLVLARSLLSKSKSLPNLHLRIYTKPPLAPKNNYSITLLPRSYRPLLRLLGLDENEFRRRIGVGQGSGEEMRVNRGALESLLREGVEVREKEVRGLTIGGEVEFKDGERQKGGVVVGADGVHSTIRKSVLEHSQSQSRSGDFEILPFAVYRGKRRVSPNLFSETAMREGSTSRKVTSSDGSTALLRISIDSSPRREKDEIDISYTYSRPAKGRSDPLFRPDRAKNEAREIPEALFEEVESLNTQLEEPFASIFSASAMREDGLLHWLMRTLSVEQDVLEAAAREMGVLLLGEAAHAEPILGGLGANEAIEDAMVLADFLVENREDGLEKFYGLRKREWDRGVEASRVRIAEMHGVPHANL